MYPCLKKHWTTLYPYVPLLVPLLKKTSDLPGTPVPLPVPCTCTNIPKIPCTQNVGLALYIWNLPLIPNIIMVGIATWHAQLRDWKAKNGENAQITAGMGFPL